jgi:hypothetical protein
MTSTTKPRKGKAEPDPQTGRPPAAPARPAAEAPSAEAAPSDTNGTGADAQTESPAGPPGSGPLKRGPIHRFRYHVPDGMLSVSVFDKVIERNAEEQVLYSVSVQRSYYSEKERKWLWTGYLRDGDVPVALVGLQEAYRFITNRKMPAEDTPF